jgi:hypothetical protein
MRLIQRYLPNPDHIEVNRIFVQADPQFAWEVARHFDGSTIPWIRLLFDLREIPNLLKGKPAETKDRRIGVDQIAALNRGFKVLDEVPGKEVVVGAIGQFWHLQIPFFELPPSAYSGFAEKGWGKVVWAIRVDPYLGGSSITLELRTSATDATSWRKLQRYYSIIGPFSKLIRESAMHQLESKLKRMSFSSDDEMKAPGDKLLPDATHSMTFHKNIEAPVSIVWSYLMQLGCDRAGWYSIDALDHGGIESIDHLVPGWESRKPGDRISATLSHDSFFEVYQVEHEMHFVIGGETKRFGGPYKMTWAFILTPIGEDATHLISRVRMTSSPPWADWVMGNLVYPPIHTLMSAAQLRHIKQLAERDACARKEEQVLMQLN